MTLHAAADHLAFQNVEGRKERRRAVALVIMRHGSGAALLHRQSRLGPIERLDLALLVEGKDDGMGRRIDIKTYHVAQLRHEFRIGGKLELLDLERLQAMRPPDPGCLL